MLKLVNQICTFTFGWAQRIAPLLLDGRNAFLDGRNAFLDGRNAFLDGRNAFLDGRNALRPYV